MLYGTLLNDNATRTRKSNSINTNTELSDVPMAGEKTRSQQMDALNSSEMELNNPNSASKGGGFSVETTKLLQGVEKSYKNFPKLGV